MLDRFTWGYRRFIKNRSCAPDIAIQRQPIGRFQIDSNAKGLQYYLIETLSFIISPIPIIKVIKSTAPPSAATPGHPAKIYT